ncbi:MAG: DNA primase [Candidatus Magasanikbacteria bacterium]
MAEDTERIKNKIDIVNFISEYVDLKPAGKNHKALCPLHNENTPSFMVNRERQMWHCFGCGRGGDIFTFIQEMEDMDFVEALQFLAERAGVELSNNFQNKTQQNLKNRLRNINEEAAEFYHNFLVQMDSAQEAREYLKNRGLTQETVDYWQIGFVPDQWELLTQYMLNEGYAIDDLVESGLTKKKSENSDRQTGRGYYDRFRGRIMFPIRNVHGTTVGFTGRTIKKDDYVGGKYINTPDTPIYDKSEIVFGLYKSKQEIRNQDQAVLVEGQMDVVACHQAGMENVIAVSGTSLNEAQIDLLNRYTDNLSIAFDNDDAGVKAAKRGIRMAMEKGMHVNIIEIPPELGEDPDEAVKNDKEGWFEAVEEAQDIMEWYFECAFEEVDIDDPKQKQKAVDELLPEIASISYAVERDHWLQQLADRVGVETNVLRDDLKRFETKDKNQQEQQEKPKESKKTKKSRLTKLMEYFLGLLLRFPELELKEFPFSIERESDKELFKLYQEISVKNRDVDQLRSKFKKQEGENIIDYLLMLSQNIFPDLSSDDAADKIRGIGSKLKEEWVKNKRKFLQKKIQQAEKNNNDKKAEKLLEELKSLNN